ncbi:hypothetical protein [Thalassomonas actiniarum]|uniref:Uncharacterized protein n=1 Tax=Thalassomonas actiniarum TaxID=485447 RepID=A0AAE9YL13_9GAMM|nr:hypothetical protein [Thalassomonas actiniarum]WDD96718.1 hypothetical protein SG35_015170 [Thalassomonas actiniarum]
MANPNDMPEFHSVKVSLTENIPNPQYLPTTHAANVTNTSNGDNTCVQLTFMRGRYHV